MTGRIHEVQVTATCQLLVRTNEPITTMAARAGFADPSHFNRIFKRLRDCTPRHFRQLQPDSATC